MNEVLFLTPRLQPVADMRGVFSFPEAPYPTSAMDI